ncbi:MAG: triple tyrosine motif-containing protein, partial [Ferruginibacter sp.]
MLLPVLSSAQVRNNGLPFITNYHYQDYGADGINWWAAEDDKGVMYFANNSGILVYDGQHWELVKPIKNSETRTLVKGKDGKIYVGTTGDIGFIDTGNKGNLIFTSLSDKIPKAYREFAEVWESGRLGDEVYFRTIHNIYLWNGSSMRIVKSNEELHVGSVVHGKNYVRIWNRGLTVMEKDSFHLVPGGERFASERIYVILPYDETKLLIGTRTQGLFIYDGKQFTPFKTEADKQIVNTSLYGGTVLPGGNFALNTFNDGLFIIDKQGHLVQKLDKSVGLQDNSVGQVFVDSRGLVWLSLFNGISKIDLNSSLSYYDESMGLPAKTIFGLGYDKGNIYAGTNNGAYMLNNSSNRFQKLEGTSGQAGNFIHAFGDFLVAGAEKGMLKINGSSATQILQGKNYEFHVTQISRSAYDTNILYVALREGIAAVRHYPVDGNTGKYVLESLNLSLKTVAGGLVERSDGTLWIFNSLTGKINLLSDFIKNGKTDLENARIKVYTSKDGLSQKPVTPINFNNKTYFINGPDSIFVYDGATDRFKLDTAAPFRQFVKSDADATPGVVTDNRGREWANFGAGTFVTSEDGNGKIKFISSPFSELNKKFPVWDILPLDFNNGIQQVWFSGREGVIKFEGKLDSSAGQNFTTIIREVKLNGDSLVYSGLEMQTGNLHFSEKFNDIRIQYASPFFIMEKETVFSTYLEGKDESWNEWTKQDYREFGNLQPGKYVFHVKAKNAFGDESKEASFSFSVAAPWYATWWAYLLYAILAGLMIYAIVKWRTRSLEEKHRELEGEVALRTKELSSRVDELAVINSVQDGLAKELDMQAIYELVGNKIQQVFNAQAVIIASFDHEKKSEHFNYHIEKGEISYPETRPY